ncbi:MAG: hypothetical protein K5899_00190 [Bacteroidaceae bacterium]|jgi:predicted esterase YcpF (UPF0227 family)|nr:hypothetical protein [Bacteroidaceae bacterium]
MKILYFHGFASSGATGTAESLRRMLPEVEVISPDIPVDPSEALPFLRALCEQEKPDLIIGTSMGAMYAQQMFGYKKICVNPAFNMSTLSKVFRTGEHKFLNGRKDSQKTFKITKEIIQKQNMMERQQFKGITPFDRENTYGLFGIHDTTVNCYDLFKKYYTKAQRFDGEHHLNEKALRTAVVPLAKTILGLE